MSEQPQDLYNLKTKTDEELIEFVRAIPSAGNKERQAMIIAVHEEIVSRGSEILPTIAAEITKGYANPQDAFVVSNMISALGAMEGLLANTSLLLESLLSFAQLNVASEDELSQFKFDVLISGQEDDYKKAQIEISQVIKKATIALIDSLAVAQDTEELHAFAAADFLVNIAGGYDHKAQIVKDFSQNQSKFFLGQKNVDVDSLLAELKSHMQDADDKTRDSIVRFITEVFSAKLTTVGEKVMFYLWLLTGGDPDNMDLEPVTEL